QHMRTLLRVLGTRSAFALLASIGCRGEADCTDQSTCPPAVDASADADAAADSPEVPLECDEAADATAPAAQGCLTDSFAVFVDGNSGVDTNEGSKVKPLKSISAALIKAASQG